MVDALVLCSLLFLQGPAERLEDAVDDVQLQEVQRAVGDLARGDDAQAAKVLIAILPRVRAKLDKLARATVSARAAYDRIDSAFTFNSFKTERELREKSLEKAKIRIKESSTRAVQGEMIYDVIRDAFARLGPGAVRELTREINRTRSWILKCELIEALGTMRAEEPLIRGVREEEEPVVLATYLHSVQTEEARPHLDHPQWQVRLAALRSLRASKGSVEKIMGTLKRPDIRYQVEACRALAEITRTKLPADAPIWQDWWEANGKDFVSNRYHPALRKEKEGPGRTTFYGVPITSSRVCFIIDRSRSMRKEDRFDKAARELNRLLNELPNGSRFNILFFGEHVSSFCRSTRELDSRARKDAARFIERQKADRGTDLYKALEEGLTLVGNAESGRLREDGVDTFIVLSDGEATVGRLVNNELVARVITRRVRYLRPVIHAISLSSEAESMKLLADITGGEYRRR